MLWFVQDPPAMAMSRCKYWRLNPPHITHLHITMQHPQHMTTSKLSVSWACFGSRSFALLLRLFGTPFLWPFVVVVPLTVFGANSKLSSITLLSGLLNAPVHPAPQIRRVSRRHCALYKFTYLLTYLIAQTMAFRHCDIQILNGQYR